ncbi:MAG: 16S rRNA (adenine(1518)-N(6)/adenine(1519)-N(6))-dimethyltransferase RsmA [Candidatus Pacebacteria bacterium]|nr:16S rRNA (adenine(1518)-N(6)/adenine(1519)-N(6))-dimethyltransferase RsmA [Candidatus Paceibacterota bacterium]
MVIFFPKKSLGQNFLIQPQVALDMAFSVSNSDLVVEIGPGTGALTKKLLEKGARVIAVEKDNLLYKRLSEENVDNLEVIHGDVLETDLFIKEPYKIVANIPYYITGKIIRHFLETENQPTSMTLLIQKEVAERIVAKDSKESLLSISVKVYGNPTYIKTVKRGNFNPIPKVDSAILHIENISRDNFKNLDENLFFKVLKTGFSSKRKKVSKNLKSLIRIEDPRRPEDLSLKDWLDIVRKMSQQFQ